MDIKRKNLNFSVTITIACKDMPADADVSRFGVVRMNEDSRITDFEEKPLVAQSNTISTGVYIIRRRQLIEILEKSAEENRFDFVTDVLVRYRNVKRVYGYKLNSYWSNIASVDDYFRTNMDYIDGKKELREINMEFNARYVHGEDMPGRSGCGYK